MNRFSFRTLVATAVTAGLLLGMTGVAKADDVVNNVDTTVDSTREEKAVPVGGSAAVKIFVLNVNTNGGDSGNECNLSGNNTSITLAVASANASIASVSPAQITIDSCDENAGKIVTIAGVANGTVEINIAQVSATTSNGGTFNLAPAQFKAVVGTGIPDPSDTTPPVITKIVSGTLGSNGWYTSNVSVTWTVTDPESAVVIDSDCHTQNFATETTGATSSCSAHSAGGPAAASVDLKIDKTGPSASLSPSGTLGDNGWYTSNVSVTTSGTDDISGGVTCDGVQTLASETTGQTVKGSCTNSAGLSTNATPITIKVDKTGPSAILTPSGNPGSNNWFTSNVEVTTSGDDSISGSVTCSEAQPLGFETTGTVVNGSCKNDAGLSTNASPITVKIDKSNPSASLSPAGTLGSDGWYTSPVVVSTIGADTISTPLSCTADQPFSTDTTGTPVNGSCTNDAGLKQNADPITIKIDQSAPTNVQLSVLSGTPGNNGWYTTDVVVHASGEDSISGVTCTENKTVTAEGTTIVTGSCTNGAGQTTNAAPLTIRIDKSAPTIVATASTASGPYSSDTWTNKDVTVHFTCTDAISDIATCPADVVVSAETAASGEDVSGTTTDKAGHSAMSDILNVKIDKTAPTIKHLSTSPSANENGWNKSDVTVTWSCTDALSGEVASGDSEALTTEGASQSATGTCADHAGNSASDTQEGINIDKTAPTIEHDSTIQPANAAGWNNSDVTVTWSCSDGLSGASSPIDSETLNVEGTNKSATGTCSDLAGNTASDTQDGINIDKTAPAVTLVGEPTNGATYYFGSVPAAPTCDASDGLSGLDGTCSVRGYSNEKGTHTVTAAATDLAGNANSASATYTVLAWTLNGFYQPVDMNGVFNVVKGGSTVPLKFEVFAGTTELTNLSVVQSFVQTKISCSPTITIDDVEITSTGGTTLRYDSTGGQFIQNWQTPKQPGQCYKVTMTTQDGTPLTALFKLK